MAHFMDAQIIQSVNLRRKSEMYMEKLQKHELIKSLSRIKLVLGNGFDLHCGLKSSFNHYYKYCKSKKGGKKIEFISKWYARFKSNYDIFYSPIPEDSQTVKRIKEISVWDFFFTIVCIERNRADFENYLWSQVEKDITLSLFHLKVGKEENEEIESIVNQLTMPINWDSVYKELTASKRSSIIEVCAIAQVVNIKTNNSIYSEDDFYAFLLDELKQFEKEFASFLNWLLIDTSRKSFGIVAFNHVFYLKALDTINEICGFDNLVAIDSFNYSYFGEKDNCISPLMRHINGDIDNPIFGIDSIHNASSPKFSFAKTSRRMMNDVVSDSASTIVKYDNVIIYGHSLNSADYSYFFPVFDELKLLDNNATSKIVFAYSIFDPSQKEKIINDMRKSIFEIFEKYAEEKHYDFPNRFLDSLTSRGRIIMLEVSLLNENNYYKNFADDRWESIETK